MNQALLPRKTPDPALSGMIKLAVLAVGGQGGGVLIGWIEDLARAAGYACQATSVAGVAQRTGSTLYYIELCKTSGRTPVFSLMPAAGDVDIMIAAELMEAGRSIMRGFVTPDRTVLIASTHRALAVSEKMVPGDGIADPAEVLAAAEIAARQFIAADFEAVAAAEHSVISAALFGGLAASGALPFARSDFEAAIAKGGKGVEPSLRAFSAGFSAATAAPQSAPDRQTAPPLPDVTGPQSLREGWQALCSRAGRLPQPAMALAGLRKVVDFQDLDYGADYLARLETLAALDAAPHDLTCAGAKYIANAMAYDDVIRVADLKTRRRRFDRIAAEMNLAEGQLLQLTEYVHPRAAEVVGLLPARLGQRMAANPRAMARIDRWFCRGRHLRSDGLLAFVAFYVIGGLKFWRRRTLRHAQETAHLEQWLHTATGYLPNRALAAEVIRCRRLIKGYSDTHDRGQSKFDRVLAGIALVAQRDDAADWARRLRDAALQDEKGVALDGALETLRSFA